MKRVISLWILFFFFVVNNRTVSSFVKKFLTKSQQTRKLVKSDELHGNIDETSTAKNIGKK